MPSELNNLLVKELVSLFEPVKDGGCVVVDYAGLKAEDAVAARRSLRKQELSVHVVKNSIARIAFTRLGIEKINELVDGPSAIVWGKSDPVATSRTTKDALRGYASLKIKGGFAQGRLLDLKMVNRLAAIGSKEQLLAQFLGTLTAPGSRFAHTLKATPQRLVLTLKAIQEKKGGDAKPESAEPNG